MAEQTIIKKNAENEIRGCGIEEKAAIRALCKKVGLTDEEIEAEK